MMGAQLDTQEAAMSSAEPRYFQTLTIKVDIWLHPNNEVISQGDLVDRVTTEICNAADAAAKELSAPDEGIEVVVRS
jgi:hypothetical protein